MVTLTLMPIEHVPVLATELLDVLDPHPGETAIDCTFGGGGHARLIAERLGSGGTLVAIDRDPAAERRFDELADELELRDAVRASRLRRRPRRRSAREGVRADVIYLDLGVSSLQLDAAERGFSYSYDAPLDMRMDPDDGLSAADLVNEWPEERIAAVLRELRRGAPRALDRRARSSAAGPLRHDGGAGGGGPRRRPARLPVRPRPSRQAHLPGDPDRRQRRARLARPRRCPAAWDLLRDGGRLAAISFHSLEDRRVKRFLADRARGCVCPPELPVCAAGTSPRPSCSPAAALAAEPRGDRAQPALALGASARRAQARRGADGRRRRKDAPDDRRPPTQAARRAAAPAPQRRARRARSARRSARARDARAGRAAHAAPARRRRCRRGSSRSRSGATAGAVSGTRRLGPRPPPHPRPAVDRRSSTTLLVGIVALNVFALSFNAASSSDDRPDRRARARRTRPCRAQIAADGASSDRMQAAAGARPDRARARRRSATCDASPKDAAIAAKRLAAGAIAAIATAPPAPRRPRRRPTVADRPRPDSAPRRPDHAGRRRRPTTTPTATVDARHDRPTGVTAPATRRRAAP